MLWKVKAAMRIASTTFDDELRDLIAAAKGDLRVAGVTCADIDCDNADIEDPLVLRAVITYCKTQWPGFSAQHDYLKKSYDEQKAQLSMDTGHTDWG